MGMRIKPKEIEIPEGDPFANDLFGRREPIEILTHLCRNIEGPCVMAVDAPWGAGKTTFINLWYQHLYNEHFAVVRFNAWENDFCNDPFIALLGELTPGLSSQTEKFNNLMEVATEIGLPIALKTLSCATGGWVNISPQLFKEGKGDTGGAEIETRLKSYKEAKDAREKFKKELKSMVSPSDSESPQEAAASNGKRSGPLIVIIDELDRCRPLYAVEFLEVAKHLFSVDHMVFVIAIHRKELAHSIKALYGEEFDAENYLRRFFDVDFRLPEPDKEAFIKNIFKEIKIIDYFIRTEDSEAKKLEEMGRRLLVEFFKTFNPTLRQIEQAVHRVGPVLASVPDEAESFYLATIAALILRTINTQFYYDFIDGRASDLEVVEEVFAGSEGEKLQRTDAGSLFEAILILASRERARAAALRIIDDGATSPSREEEIDHDTPLQKKYRSWLEASRDTTQEREHADRVHADNVLKLVKKNLGLGTIRNPFCQLGFSHAVMRLERLGHSKDGASE